MSQNFLPFVNRWTFSEQVNPFILKLLQNCVIFNLWAHIKWPVQESNNCFTLYIRFKWTGIKKTHFKWKRVNVPLWLWVWSVTEMFKSLTTDKSQSVLLASRTHCALSLYYVQISPFLICWLYDYWQRATSLNPHMLRFFPKNLVDWSALIS